jgi:hypothetical protein
MTRTIVVDRHAFASNASSFNTAWETFGWTPALEGARASRLEEQVPWATLAARAESPARLSGPYERVIAPANFDRLQFGALPLDGRYGFSVWGAIGERRGGEWRVLTHTLLFDDDGFDLMAGFPQGLLTIAGRSDWFRELVERSTFTARAPLAPITLERTRATRAAFEQARRAEIARLRARLLPLAGGAARLEAELATVLEALARTRNGGPIRHVALRSVADGRTELLVRLAWTALPLADRADTSFVTEQRRTDAPRATLFGLPDAEWGQYVPPNTQLLEPDRPHTADIARGRQEWARSIARDEEAAHDRLSAQVDSRRWRVVGRDDVGALETIQAWRGRWRAGDDRPALAGELLALEGGNRLHVSGRVRAAGHVAALAHAASADASGALIAAFRPYPAAATTLVRAAVRTLARNGEAGRARALRLRCEAIQDPPLVPPDELFRLFDREAYLLEALGTSDAATALFRAAVAAGCAGHVQADRLIAAALPTLPDPVAELARIPESRAASDPRVGRVLAQATERVLDAHADRAPDGLASFVEGLDAALLLQAPLLDVLIRWCEAHADGERTDVDFVVRLGCALLHALRTGTASNGVRERVLRVLWIEERSGGGRAASRFAGEAPADAAAVLIPLLVVPAPLPVFVGLRQLVGNLPHAAGNERMRPWLAELEDYCPALHERLTAAAAPIHA